MWTKRRDSLFKSSLDFVCIKFPIHSHPVVKVFCRLCCDRLLSVKTDVNKEYKFCVLVFFLFHLLGFCLINSENNKYSYGQRWMWQRGIVAFRLSKGNGRANQNSSSSTPFDVTGCPDELALFRNFLLPGLLFSLLFFYYFFLVDAPRRQREYRVSDQPFTGCSVEEKNRY